MILNVTITTALGRTREQFRLNEQFFGEDEEEVIEFGGRPVLGYIVLSTTSIRREDAGEYRCVVNNTAGQQTIVNITVNVQGEQVQHLAYIATSRNVHKNMQICPRQALAFKTLV